MDPYTLGLYGVLGVFVLLFARGAYIIWVANDPKDKIRHQQAKLEGREDVNVKYAYHRGVETEAHGRLYLFKRKLKDWWPF